MRTYKRIFVLKLIKNILRREKYNEDRQKQSFAGFQGIYGEL